MGSHAKLKSFASRHQRDCHILIPLAGATTLAPWLAQLGKRTWARVRGHLLHATDAPSSAKLGYPEVILSCAFILIFLSL
jgi:hypothetical protein